MIFLFFGSSLACLEPELELFEVWEINVRQFIIIANGINSRTPKLQTALARVTHMYVCMYIYRNCKNLSLFSSRMATFQTQFKRERRHGLTSTSLQLDQQAGKLKMFGKFQQSASSSISYPCHVLYQVCVYFIPGGRLEAREKL